MTQTLQINYKMKLRFAPSVFLLLAFVFSNTLYGQLSEDFSDGDIANNPTWVGDMDKFQVVDGQLQLNDTDAGSSNTTYLALPANTSLSATTTWEFYIEMDFPPSSSNYSKIYLMSDQADLTGSLNGYFLRVGGISGSDDALELYKQSGTSTTLFLSGTAGAVGSQPAIARVKVSRSTDGNWQLEADYTGGTAYQDEGSANDTEWTEGRYFGLVCKYTSTRSDAFFFDDVLIDPIVQDETGPQLTSVKIVSSTELNLLFDEPIDGTSAMEVNNYSVDGSIGIPSTAFPNGAGVNLNFSTPLQSQQSYTLVINDILDLAANNSGLQSYSFSYYEIEDAEVGDIVINEIMADPNPSVALPEYEYIELYNRSNKIIDLSSLYFVVGSAEKPLPDYNFLPGAYLILCVDDAEAAFTSYGDVVALSNFGTLTNSGTRVAMEKPDGTIINEVNYSSSWYQDADKDDGGWSLELVNPEGPYDCGGNWIASQDIYGGTPSAANSVLGEVLDISGPIMLRAVPLSENELSVVFNEAIDPSTINDFNNYEILNGPGIEQVLIEGENDGVLLLLDGDLQENTIYTLTLGSGITDCLGNAMLSGNQIAFGLSSEIESGDIIINEILFDPYSGGNDFVELYNRTEKVLDLNGLKIGNAYKNTAEDITASYLLLPNEYVVLSENIDAVKSDYIVPYPQKMLETELPGFDNDAGNVSLVNGVEVIDSFGYSAKMHFSLLSDKEGVSLERINPNVESWNDDNWHSAAATVGFATPTYQNSQYIDLGEIPESNIFNIPNTTFSPDGDGEEDVLVMNYEVTQTGYSVNLIIFDAMGRQVTQLASNIPMGTAGLFKWDGTDAEGLKVRMGIYVVWAEIFHPDGDVEYFKESCVLAKRLN